MTQPATTTAHATSIAHLNPEGMARNLAFSQGIAVTGPHRVVYIGGKNAVEAAGTVVGKGDLGAQTRQIFHNLKTVLAAADARLEHVVRWTIHVVQGQPLGPAFEVFRAEWGHRPNPPTITMVYVAGLAHPDYLCELDAIAVVPT